MMRRLVELLLFLLLFLLMGGLALRNAHMVRVDMILWQGEGPLIMLLIAAFALGAFVAWVLGLPFALRARFWRAHLMRLKRDARN